LEVVTETTMNFDGSEQTFAIYHNPAPIKYRLPATVDGAAIEPIPKPVQ
jgi:hypothetical protein